MSNGSIPVGDIRFYDSYRSLLYAGDYTIDIKQQVDSTDEAHPLSNPVPDVLQKFSVIAPRFALDPSEVQSVFPPANASGQFDLHLPHIVLMQRALPWERVLGDKLPKHSNPNIGDAYPWIALLLFTEDEIRPPPDVPVTSSMANPTKAGTYAVDEIRTPTTDATILGSNVAALPEDEKFGRAIDITTDVFTRVTPRLAELPFLAHARQVNVDNKTTSLALTNGWFSVVVANRFPLVKDAPSQRWIAHLVSLEGFADYLVDKPDWPDKKTTVRLPSLVSWSFTSQPLGADFSKLMANLVARQTTGDDGLRLSLKPPAATGTVAPDSAEDHARKALAQGYTALQYETRVGNQTFAWYHGPFVPHPVPVISAGTAFANSAAAIIYESDSGTFDLSYAAAWELGRMLALSDRAYSTNQQRARKAIRKVVNLVRERTRWQAGSQLLAAAANGNVRELLHPQYVSRSVASWMATEAAKHLPRPDRAPEPAPPANGPRAKRAPAVADLRALHEHAAVQAQVQAQTQESLTGGPVKDMAGWLGRLRLLEGIPFVHLVPDARMLPVESIRFFYVDPNTLDALCDGAQSVGLQNSRDALQQSLVRDTMREAATSHVHSRRATLTGRKMLAEDATSTDPVAGFLLRSAVVSGWPGLEIKAFTDLGGTNQIMPLRIDHIASDVLIALFPKVPARIDIDEPKEGLVFGVELVDGQWVVGVRNITGTETEMGTVIDKLPLGPDGVNFLRDGGVLQVDALQLELSKKFGPQVGMDFERLLFDPEIEFANASAVWGPAAFGLQMVDAPQRMTFDNRATP